MLNHRLPLLDTLRGLAMVWMTIFHFCFDLNYFGWIQQDFYTNPLWQWQRSCIVGLFLFCMGFSQALAPHFSWRRLWQISICAALVTVSSYAMFPKSFIYFGILHSVAVMLLILRLLRPLGDWLWLVGTVCWLLFFYPPFIVNYAPWHVLGLISQKPMTEDFVPLLPWLAVVCWGHAFGLRALTAKKMDWYRRPIPSLCLPLAFLGRYSLRYYMLHQPVLIGLLYLCRLA